MANAVWSYWLSTRSANINMQRKHITTSTNSDKLCENPNSLTLPNVVCVFKGNVK